MPVESSQSDNVSAKREASEAVSHVPDARAKRLKSAPEDHGGVAAAGVAVGSDFRLRVQMRLREQRERLTAIADKASENVEDLCAFQKLPSKKQAQLVIQYLPGIIARDGAPPSMPSAQPIFEVDVEDVDAQQIAAFIQDRDCDDLFDDLKDYISLLIDIIKQELCDADAEFEREKDAHAHREMQRQRMEEGSLNAQLSFPEEHSQTPSSGEHASYKDILRCDFDRLSAGLMQISADGFDAKQLGADFLSDLGLPPTRTSSRASGAASASLGVGAMPAPIPEMDMEPSQVVSASAAPSESSAKDGFVRPKPQSRSRSGSASSSNGSLVGGSGVFTPAVPTAGDMDPPPTPAKSGGRPGTPIPGRASSGGY